MKSTRSDAWEAQLPADTAKELYRLAKPPTKEEVEAGRPYLRDFDRDVLPYLSLHGIVAPSRAGWYRFLGRMRVDESAKVVISMETARRIATGEEVAKFDPRVAANFLTGLSLDEATKVPEERNDEAMKILAAAAAKFHAAALADDKLKLDAARQKTADAQLKLAREKFEAAEKRLSAVQGAVDAPRLTDAERVAKIKSIFGMI